jgi:hypothetical protein
MGRWKKADGRCRILDAFIRKTEVKSKKVAQKFLILEIFHNFAAEDCNYEE